MASRSATLIASSSTHPWWSSLPCCYFGLFSAAFSVLRPFCGHWPAPSVMTPRAVGLGLDYFSFFLSPRQCGLCHFHSFANHHSVHIQLSMSPGRRLSAQPPVLWPQHPPSASLMIAATRLPMGKVSCARDHPDPAVALLRPPPLCPCTPEDHLLLS